MIIDAIMLTNTADDEIYQMTRNAIKSLRASEPDIQFNIKLIETSPIKREYDAEILRFNGPFGYNKSLNVGLRACTSDFILTLNNDLLFESGWLTVILKAMRKNKLDSASPRCIKFEAHNTYTDDTYLEGYQCSYTFCGWCVVYRRKSIMSIYPLNENFRFHCQDNWMIEKFIANSYKHALVGKSKITHLLSQSHRLISEEDFDELIHKPSREYDSLRNEVV